MIFTIERSLKKLNFFPELDQYSDDEKNIFWTHRAESDLPIGTCVIRGDVPKNPESIAFRIFLSKPQAWHIITAQRAVYIISPSGLYLITRQRVFSCGLMIYNFL